MLGARACYTERVRKLSTCMWCCHACGLSFLHMCNPVWGWIGMHTHEHTWHVWLSSPQIHPFLGSFGWCMHMLLHSFHTCDQPSLAHFLCLHVRVILPYVQLLSPVDVIVHTCGPSGYPSPNDLLGFFLYQNYGARATSSLSSSLLFKFQFSFSFFLFLVLYFYWLKSFNGLVLLSLGP